MYKIQKPVTMEMSGQMDKQEDGQFIDLNRNGNYQDILNEIENLKQSIFQASFKY